MTDWDQLYNDQNTPWEKGEPAPCLVDYLKNNVIEGEILVPGCGAGHDVRALAASGAEAVVGLDVAPAAIQLAESFSRTGNERYVCGDLFDLPASWNGAFDAIWEHTCFCAIHPTQRSAYVEAVTAALKSQGSLIGVFYLNPYDDEHQPGEGPPFGVEKEELEDFFLHEFELLEQWVPERAYPGREGRELMVRMRRKS